MNRSNIEYLAAITQIQPSRLSLTRFLSACLVAVVALIMGTIASTSRVAAAITTFDVPGAASFDVPKTSNGPSGPNKPSIVITGNGVQAHTVQLMARRGTYTITATAVRFCREFRYGHSDIHGAASRQVSSLEKPGGGNTSASRLTLLQESQASMRP